MHVYIYIYTYTHISVRNNFAQMSSNFCVTIAIYSNREFSRTCSN